MEHRHATELRAALVALTGILVVFVAVATFALWQQQVGRDALGAPIGQAPSAASVRHLSATPVLGEARAPSPAPCPAAMLVDVPMDAPILSGPGAGARIGTMLASSRYMRTPTTAWVERVSGDGRFGLVTVPFSSAGATTRGWIDLTGLNRSRTPWRVILHRSRHELTLEKSCKAVASFPAGTGRAGSPTPTGRYFVVDRVNNPGGAYGSYAFGLSGLQTHPPAGWTGPAQLAIHGTNDPSTIGRSSSAGCPHLSKQALDRLVPVMRLGTPVIIRN